MTRHRQLFSHTRQKSRRKELRNDLTPAEIVLWSLIKNKQIQGRKFRCQHGIGPYIVDFCCTSEKLIIELDGEVHNDSLRREYDAARDKQLTNLGFTVLRFENKHIFRDTESVLHIITSAFKN